jgi:hypothetical protein
MMLALEGRSILMMSSSRPFEEAFGYRPLGTIELPNGDAGNNLAGSSNPYKRFLLVNKYRPSRKKMPRMSWLEE